MRKTKIQIILAFEQFKYISEAALRLLFKHQNTTTQVLVILILILAVLGWSHEHTHHLILTL